jgi:hypothetical protein
MINIMAGDIRYILKASYRYNYVQDIRHCHDNLEYLLTARIFIINNKYPHIVVSMLDRYYMEIMTIDKPY